MYYESSKQNLNCYKNANFIMIWVYNLPGTKPIHGCHMFLSEEKEQIDGQKDNKLGKRAKREKKEEFHGKILTLCSE